jgi:glyoxylase-like metal-dependent hydrolase (beta-lactamase superfamily II)
MKKYILAAAVALLATALTACSDGHEAWTEPSGEAAQDEAGAGATVAEQGIANRGNEAADADKWWSALPRQEWSSFEKIETLNPWFEVYQIMDGIYAIYEPGQFEEVISYLIVGRRGALLFDTGLGMGDIKSVVRQLTKLPITVLNSHTHYDHVGGNHQFEIVIGRNLPFTVSNSRGKTNAEVGEYALGDWVWKTYPPRFNAKTYAIKPWEFSRWVTQGQFIDLGGVSLEVVYAPGHAPDSIVLVDHARRLMFTGDTFYLAPLYAHLEGSNFSAYSVTAAKLAVMAPDIDFLLMSHNTPMAEGRYLQDLHQAFQGIINGTANYSLSDGGREYDFGGFSILTPDPPEDDAPVIDLL